MSINNIDLLELAKQSYSVSDMIVRLGLSITGANHLYYKTRLKELGFEHTSFSKRPTRSQSHQFIKLVDLLTKNSKISSSRLRGKLIINGLLEDKCKTCGLGPEWQGKPLSLHLDHIDGDHYNNELTNLQILCPNCHSQTDTYGTLKEKPIKPLDAIVAARIASGRKTIKSGQLSTDKKCKTCNIPLLIRNKTGYCKDHYRGQIKSNARIDYEQLRDDIKLLGWSGTGRKYDVSSNAIRRWIRVHIKNNQALLVIEEL